MVLPLGKHRATRGPGVGVLSRISKPKLKAFLLESFSDLTRRGVQFSGYPLGSRRQGINGIGDQSVLNPCNRGFTETVNDVTPGIVELGQTRKNGHNRADVDAVLNDEQTADSQNRGHADMIQQVHQEVHGKLQVEDPDIQLEHQVDAIELRLTCPTGSSAMLTLTARSTRTRQEYEAQFPLDSRQPGAGRPSPDHHSGTMSSHA